MFILGLVLGVAGGGAAVWFFREPLTVWYKGAENYVGALNDKIKALKGE